jgi:peroxiredoxin
MRRLAALIIVLAALAVLVYKETHHRLPSLSAGALPDLSFVDLNDKTLNTSDYKGKVLLVNFWAAWCVPCAKEVPQFIVLQKKYQQQGLQIIGFSVDDQEQELHDFFREHQMNYPVVPSNAAIAEAFGGIFGLPTTILVDREGRIRSRHEGSVDFSAIEKEILGLLSDQRR